MAAWQHVVEETIQASGLELVHAEVVGSGGAQTLRVYVDQPGGVGLDDCERASRALSAALDAAATEAVPDADGLLRRSYVLEVSSPGLDRPLVKRADFERFAGERVRVATHLAVQGSRHFQGQLCGVSDAGVEIAAAAGVVLIGWDNVHKARLAPQWPGPAPKPGGPRRKPGRRQ